MARDVYDVLSGPVTVPQTSENNRALWEKEVHGLGGVVVNAIPKGPYAGQLGFRVMVNGAWRYFPAPAALRTAAKKADAQLQADIAAGARVEAFENAGRTVLQIPRTVLSEVTGVPPWLVPVALVGVGVMALRSLLPQRRG